MKKPSTYRDPEDRVSDESAYSPAHHTPTVEVTVQLSKLAKLITAIRRFLNERI